MLTKGRLQMKLLYRTLSLIHVVLIVHVHMLDVDRLDGRVTDDDRLPVQLHVYLNVTYSGPLFVDLVFQLSMACK
jgi:hypothetical protein